MSERVKLTEKQRTLIALKQMRARLDRLEATQKEPIAVVGIGCRFPGASGPDAFWNLLLNGRDGIAEIPSSRWNIDDYFDPVPGRRGKMYTKWGGFLENVDEFDADFFGISPREATSLDPQQRLLIEVVWEALEDAGQSPRELAGSTTGVFLGICTNDYVALARRSVDIHKIDAYFGSGNAFSTASGRISYILGLQGPSISIDTACSSSLVALHLACGSLRDSESAMALVGGVNLILTPESTINFCQARMLSPEGMCKTFDAAADGYVRSEGCGVIVLKRHSDALENGDRILALIRGTAVNQDGHSSGLTAPNGPSQVRVIRRALEAAGVRPADVGYVEAHGTATQLGDPIEFKALGDAFSEGRSRPLVTGSLKTNIGHLEASAGVAGMIKVILSLQHKTIPPHLHFKKLSPYLVQPSPPIRITTRPAPWEPIEGRRIAGVSGFGFSGTNVHVVIEEAVEDRDVERPGVTSRSANLFVLSAKTGAALDELAEDYRGFCSANPDIDPADLAHTANNGRSHFLHRLAVTAESADDAAQRLHVYLRNRTAEGVVHGIAERNVKPKIAFLFAGRGALYAGIARDLCRVHPAFQRSLEEVGEQLEPRLGRSIVSLLCSEDPEESGVGDSELGDVCLYAFQAALSRLWRSWGVEPSLVMGHGLGEFAAASTAGVFSVEQGLTLVAERGRLIRENTRQGGMATVSASVDEVEGLIRPYGEEISIAAVNDPGMTVISGGQDAIQAANAAIEAVGISCKRLVVSRAPHSGLMEPLLDQLGRIVGEVSLRPPEIRFLSTVTGGLVRDEVARPAYWCRHIRERVNFLDSVRALAEGKCDVLLEIGLKPDLVMMARSALSSTPGLLALPVPGGEAGDWEQILQCLSELYVKGVDIDWRAFDSDRAVRKISLPTYPFQRESFWIETGTPASPERDRPSSGSPGFRSLEHPLLSCRLRSSLTEDLFVIDLVSPSNDYLMDHRVYKEPVLPATGYLELALAAAAEILGTKEVMVREFSIEQPLFLKDLEKRNVHLNWAPGQDQVYSFRVVSHPDGDDSGDGGAWSEHAFGTIDVAEDVLSRFTGLDPIDDVRARCIEEIDCGRIYRRVRDMGMDYGPCFQGVTELSRRGGEALGRIDVPEALGEVPATLQAHPAILDACLQVAGAVYLEMGRDEDDLFLPIYMEAFWIGGRADLIRWSRCYTSTDDSNPDPDLVKLDFQFFDDHGETIGAVRGLHFRRASRQALKQALKRIPTDWLYEERWRKSPIRSAASAPGLVDELLNNLLAERERIAGESSIEANLPILDRLDDICGEYAIQALVELGFQFNVGTHASIPELIREFTVKDKYRRLFRRMIQILDEDGVVECDGETLVVRRSIDRPLEPGERIAALAEEFPACAAELSLLKRCGPQLSKVLRGKQNPVYLLFPGGKAVDILSLYGESPFAKFMNLSVAETIHRAAAARAPDRDIRILEIGGGTGGTCEAVLSRLPEEGLSYLFTDVRSIILSKARKRFKGRRGVEFRKFDIGCPHEEQGLSPKSFDIILGSNSLYTAPDLRIALETVKSLLAPDGLFVLHEGTRPLRWADLVLGMTDEWWRFEDIDLRPDHPFASPEQWRSLFKECGFAMGEVFPPEARNASFPQALYITEREGEEGTASGTPDKKRWIIFADSQGMGERLAEQRRAWGEPCTLVTPGETFEAIAEDRYRVDPLSRDDLRALIGQLLEGPHQELEVVHLWSFDIRARDALGETDLQSAKAIGCGSVLHLVQALNDERATDRVSLTLVFQGVRATDGYVRNPTQSILWGLGKVIAVEHPELSCRMVDIDPRADRSEAIEALLAELAHNGDGENQVMLRKGDRFVPRLVRYRDRGGTSADLDLASDGTYLITGGLGGLGMEAAQWMIDRGARHLALMGRRSPSEDAAGAIDAWRRGGVSVEVLKVDVSNYPTLEEAFSQIKDCMPPLRGLVHCAAVIEDGILVNLDWDQFLRVLGPKVDGAWNLHRLTSGLAIDFMVLFSSATALFGSPGQGSYVAGNAFLDALAGHRSDLGLPALSVEWGAFSRVGAAAQRRLEQRFAGMGMGLIDPETGLRVLEQMMMQDVSRVSVVPIDWTRFIGQFPGGSAPPFLENFIREAGAGVDSPFTPTEPSWLPLLNEIPAEEVETKLVSLMQEMVSRVLGMEPDKRIDPTRPLNEVGLDSLLAIELRNSLQNNLSTLIPTPALFEHPTIESLSRYLSRKLFNAGNRGGEEADAEGAEKVRTLELLHVDSVLDPGITPSPELAGAADAPGTLLLTGATGYLGGYLLQELLEQTGMTIHCLVRARDEEEALRRLRNRLRELASWDEAYRSRLVPIVGDLTRPMFGLERDRYEDLAGAVDTILHNAATVNFVQSYQALRQVTVFGTKEILKLACRERLKPIHFISSAAVFGSTYYLGYDEIPEDEDISDGDGFPMGYSQTKWVTERMMVSARGRGIPATIYRPSLVSGHSDTGDCKLDDVLPLLIQGSIDYGVAPDTPNQLLDFVPVDHVSKAIVRLSLDPRNRGRSFNVVHPEPIPYHEFIEFIESRGYRVDLIPYRDWIERIRRAEETDGIISLLPFFERLPEELFTLPRVSRRNTAEGLEGSGIAPLSATELLGRYMDYFGKIGWIPDPDRPG